MERVYSMRFQGLRSRKLATSGHLTPFKFNDTTDCVVVLLHQDMWVSSEGLLSLYSCARRNDSRNKKAEITAKVGGCPK
jgi:hypothetical protein